LRTHADSKGCVDDRMSSAVLKRAPCDGRVRGHPDAARLEVPATAATAPATDGAGRGVNTGSAVQQLKQWGNKGRHAQERNGVRGEAAGGGGVGGQAGGLGRGLLRLRSKL
jgi:hypothetical protein